jgi:hypothetical protein
VLFAALALGCLALALLLLWLRPDGRSQRARAVGATPSASVTATPAAALSAAEGAGARVPHDARPEGGPTGARSAPSEPAAQPAALALVHGRLALDGAAPDAGRFRLRAADGSWEGGGALDVAGRFALGAVPATALELSFELVDLEPLDARRLILPRVELRARPGEGEPLELEWRTTPLNLRVASDAPEGRRAWIEIEGPNTHARFESDEAGKAALAVVGAGTFVFRAEQRSGWSGESVLELEDDAELDTLVIQLSPPR